MRRAVAALALMAVVALPACGDDSGSPEALCAAVADLDGPATAFQGFDPTDAEAALDRLRPARVQLGELLEAAPDGVRDDLEVEVDYVQALIEALEDVPADDPAETAARVQAVADAHPGVDEAAAALAAFAERECSGST